MFRSTRRLAVPFGTRSSSLLFLSPGGLAVGGLFHAHPAVGISSSYSTEAPAKKVPIELVKELRQKTAAGILDCQKALAASDNDINKAFTWLLDKSRKKFAEKSSRVTAHGLVGAAVDDAARRGVLVEVLLFFLVSLNSDLFPR